MDPKTAKPDPEELPEAMATSRAASEEPIMEKSYPKHDPHAIKIWAQRAKRTQELYQAGTPFYTKDNLRDLDQQLQAIRKREPGVYEVTLTDLEGNRIPTPVGVGNCWHPPEHHEDTEAIEMFYLPPHIIYCTLDSYTSPQMPRVFDPDHCRILAFQIGMYVGKRHAITKQVIHDNPLLPLEEVRAYFQEKKTQWEASRQGMNFVSTLESMPELPTVRKIIAFATSDLSTRPNNTAAAVQLALVLVVRDFFAKRQSDTGPILCYAQEPRFTDIDKQVLQEHGITVLDDPHGFLEMDEETAIISHNAEVPVRSITADVARPAVMIWNKVMDEDAEQNGDADADADSDESEPWIWADPVTPRVKKLIQDYWEIDFPEGAFVNFGPHPTIYIRKPETSDAL